MSLSLSPVYKPFILFYPFCVVLITLLPITSFLSAFQFSFCTFWVFCTQFYNLFVYRLSISVSFCLSVRFTVVLACYWKKVNKDEYMCITNYTVSQKNVPPLTCYNIDMHGLIAIIFGISVTEKVGNQNILHFLISPNLCFCTTWGNGKPENCVFSLKCCMCMLFTKNTRNTLKYHPVAPESPFTDKTIDWMHQTGPRILLTVTHMLYLNQVCHGVGRCVKDGSCSSSSLNKSQWTVLMGFFLLSQQMLDAISNTSQMTFFSFMKTVHRCIVRTAQSNCCSALD